MAQPLSFFVFSVGGVYPASRCANTLEIDGAVYGYAGSGVFGGSGSEAFGNVFGLVVASARVVGVMRVLRTQARVPVLLEAGVEATCVAILPLACMSRET